MLVITNVTMGFTVLCCQKSSPKFHNFLKNSEIQAIAVDHH